MKKIIAIVQARMGATRLPGKMLMKLGPKSAVAHVIERVKLSKYINEVWLATTTNSKDGDLVKWAEENNVLCHRGSEDDVLDRYYQTALRAKADIIVRVTGDCPLSDYEVIDKVIKEYKEGDFDYVSNVHPPTYPDGLDTEVFSFGSLEKAWKEASLKSEREHVTPYIWKNPEIFKMKNVENEEDLSEQRWTLDTQEDFDFIEKIILECGKKSSECKMKEVLEIIASNPQWKEINSMYKRNEGYAKSLEEDK